MALIEHPRREREPLFKVALTRPQARALYRAAYREANREGTTSEEGQRLRVTIAKLSEVGWPAPDNREV